MAIAHRIVRPQEQYERTGAQNLRDIRPFTTRLSEGLRSSASGLVLGFQEVSGIWARLGEKTASLLGNANLTIAMRQDSGRTRDWIEKTAGQTYITQATAYHGASDGAYREARHAEVRPVSCIDWNDLTTLIEGEAISRYRRRCSTNEGRTPPAGLVGLGRIEKILRSKIRGGGA